jgi:signal transduction histidine kinase
MRTTPARTRAVALFIASVAVPTAILVGLSLESLRREVRAIRRLTEANRELLAQQLGTEFEQRVTGAVEECLSHADPGRIEAALAACPIAERMFLFENGRLRYPERTGPNGGFLDDLRFVPPAPPGRVYPVAYMQAAPAQFFYMWLSGGPPHRMLAMLVNLKYVASRAFSVARSRMGIAADLAVRRTPGDTCSGCFREIFPFWTIAATGWEGGAAGAPGLTLFSVVNIAVMLALSLSICQLLRVYVRHWRAAENRTRFVSGFSHELKTPLANIRLYADLLRSGGGLSESDKPYSDVIVNQADQLTRRVNKVLSAVLIGQGRSRYDLREANLEQIVFETSERYRSWVEQQGFELQTCIGPAMPVECDPEAVSETLVNLLENAIKYSGRSRVVRIALRQEGATAVVEVEDHGVGILAAERVRIFEEFYRAPNAKAPGGFGLGLYLAQHAMRAHGGCVEVDSEYGHGSRFRLLFPTSGHAHDPDRRGR